MHLNYAYQFIILSWDCRYTDDKLCLWSAWFISYAGKTYSSFRISNLYNISDWLTVGDYFMCDVFDVQANF